MVMKCDYYSLFVVLFVLTLILMEMSVRDYCVSICQRPNVVYGLVFPKLYKLELRNFLAIRSDDGVTLCGRGYALDVPGL